MDRVRFDAIPSLIFRKAQLVCHGGPCKYFQPKAVRGINIGGVGTEVDWSCQADLPSELRFGKVNVNCEGWSGPGDPYVVKGSCSLGYWLHYVPEKYDTDYIWNPPSLYSYDISTIIFNVLWIGFLVIIVYNCLWSCCQPRSASGRRRPDAPYSAGRQSGARGSNWFGGSSDNPPSYAKTSGGKEESAWNPGFWTGMMFGWLANYFWGNRDQQQRYPVRRWFWDWERPYFAYPQGSWFSMRRRSPPPAPNVRSSNLGPTRPSTGIGGSTVR